MHLDRSRTTLHGKTYCRTLLRDSYRDADGKVKHHTIANLSQCSEQEIQAIALALKHKNDLEGFKQNFQDPLQLRQGLSFGAIFLLHQLAQRLGIAGALGTDRPGQLALWQVIARALAQGSRLSAVRLATSHAVGEIMDLEPFNEDHLYGNLAWLAEQQTQIEQALFRHLYPQGAPELYLYDVTSTYLEGDCNALAAWGYNRDGKEGKKQIVLGLLCDQAGQALSIEVFAGNTSDLKTFAPQIQKVAQRFGATTVTLVGDRGMIKKPQMQNLGHMGFHYITAITKPQIETLLEKKVLQLGLFEEQLAEVEDSAEKVRYLVRRNPERQKEMAASRATRQKKLEGLVQAANAYLAKHPKAKVATQEKKLRSKLASLKLAAWLDLQPQDRKLVLEVNPCALEKHSQLDGCYALKTDLPAAVASAQVVHARYKDLTLVEQNFRTMKTVELELRPVYVRLEQTTRGHALVVMLAYRLIKELEKCWSQEDITVEEGLRELDSLCLTEVVVNEQVKDEIIPEPRASLKKLFALAKVELPKKLRRHKLSVATKQKLPKHRPRRCK
jgi:transposase